MYLFESHDKTTPQRVANLTDTATRDPPFGPGYPAGIVDAAERIEVWATNITDPGNDFCEFRLFNRAGKQIANKRVSG